MPVVELVIPDLSEPAGRAVEQACADRACWPLRLVRRGVFRRSWRLELLDADGDVTVIDPPARPRVAATVHELSRRFAHFDVVPTPAAAVDRLEVTPSQFATEVCTCGLDPAHRYVIDAAAETARRVARLVTGADAVDEAWDRIERWLARTHPLGLEALCPGVPSEALDPTLPPALRRSLRRHDGQTAAAGALAEGLRLHSAAEYELTGAFAGAPGRALKLDGADRVVCAGEVLAPSLESWLLRWAEELEAGEQALDDAGDVVLVA